MSEPNSEKLPKTSTLIKPEESKIVTSEKPYLVTINSVKDPYQSTLLMVGLHPEKPDQVAIAQIDLLSKKVITTDIFPKGNGNEAILIGSDPKPEHITDQGTLARLEGRNIHQMKITRTNKDISRLPLIILPVANDFRVIATGKNSLELVEENN